MTLPASTSPTHGAGSRPDTARACAHCGLPVPLGLVRSGAADQFCCQGCETAYAVIQSCGLDRYYRLRDAIDATGAAPARTTSKRYSEFDDPVFRSLHTTPLPGGRGAADLFLEGVHCAACVWLVEKLPEIVPGVIEARLDLRRSLVRVVWDQGMVPLSRVARTLDSLGYPPHPATNNAARDAQRRADRKSLVRLGVAGACAGNVMLLALALYAGVFDVMEPQYLALFRRLSMGISLVSLAWPGSVFFRGAWASIRTRTPHLDLPISLGLGAGGVWGVVNTLRGSGEVYFDSIAVLVFALLVGRWVQQRQTRWAADAVELLFSMTPTSARRVERDERGVEIVRDVPIEAVREGDIVEVRAGDSIPADGVVASGASSIDRSLLTGESMPVETAPGDGVCAGAVNLGGRLRVRVEATGPRTRIGKLMRMVEEGTRRRARIVRFADRVSGRLVAGMLALSAATLVLWLLLDPGVAVDRATALLIVTCPCALGLATPLAVTVAVGRAARRGILVKSGEALERLASPGVVFLDKTGTLTQGRLALVEWIGDESAKPLVAALESQSSHPIAVALARDLGGPDPALAVVAHSTLGAGVEGRAGRASLVVGSPRFVRDRVYDAAIGPRVERGIVSRGLTPVLVAVNNRVVAAAGLGDPPRPEARAAIEHLRRAGWRVSVLSGDDPGVVARVAAQVGIDPCDAHGSLTPEEKLARVSLAARAGAGPPRTVVMIGDGVNDAAALAAAGVGIAVRGGAEASLAAADVYLHRPGLGAIAELLPASRRTFRVIRLGLAASLAYNALAATLAIAGLINPIIAALLMPASSLTVVALAVRARTFGDAPCR